MNHHLTQLALVAAAVVLVIHRTIRDAIQDLKNGWNQ